MKIRTINPQVEAGQKLIVPIDGLITVGEGGIVEVSTKCAVQLVKGTSDWEYVKKGEKGAEVPDSESEGDGEGDGTEDSGKSERDEVQAGFKAMTVEELQKLCVEGGYDKKEWGNLKKGLLVAYLMKKFDEAAKTASEGEETKTEEEAAEGAGSEGEESETEE